MNTKLSLATIATALLLAACGNDPIDEGNGNPADHQTQAILSVKTYVSSELARLRDAAVALQAAAPEADADGWNPTDDAAAVEAMRAEWKKARLAYERIEGAIAVIFPDLDASTDERYDGFIAEEEDDFLFDGEGVTGVHGIERILWADQHPEQVVAFESALPGYVAAAFPANLEESRAFKEGLLQRLVDDTQTMVDDFAPLALEPAAAFRGVIGSLEEQREKVTLAATGEDESRYAQHTLGDMRANLEGGRRIYEAFGPWLASVEGGAELASLVTAGFERIGTHYAGLTGDAIPEVPATWDGANPSAEDLDTAYGELFQLLEAEADPQASGSLVHSMAAAADAMSIPAE